MIVDAADNLLVSFLGDPGIDIIKAKECQLYEKPGNLLVRIPGVLVIEKGIKFNDPNGWEKID